MSLSVKVNVAGTGTIRRFQLRDEKASGLTAKVADLFPELGDSGFTVTWQDEDGDWVTIVNDEDLQIAKENIEGGTLRLRVTPHAETAKLSPSAAGQPKPRASSPAAAAKPKTDEQASAQSAPKREAEPEQQFRVFVEGLRQHVPGPFRVLMEDMHRAHAAQAVAEGNKLPVAPISPGSHGPGVAQLQHVLIELGLMHPRAIRCRAGIYGPATTRAMWAFQQRQRVPTDNRGIFDEPTRDALLRLIELGAPAAEQAQRTASTGAAKVDPAAAATESKSEPTSAPDQRPWAAELEGLRAMGFDNVEGLIPLLEQFKGSIDQLLAVLLDDASQR